MLVYRMIYRSAPLLFAALALAMAQPAAAQDRSARTIPADTIVRLKLDTALNSSTARVGDPFNALLMEDDRSGFPAGTRFQGNVREVQVHSSSQPGILDIQIHTAHFPDRRQVPVSGRLASLASDDVRRMENGRLEARERSGGEMDWKWAGYGAGAGAILAAVTEGNILRGVLIGGIGGAIYGYLTRGSGSRQNFREVSLPRGEEFGMRLEEDVEFGSHATFRYASDGALPPSLTTAERRELRYQETTVLLNGREVLLGQPPMNLNGVLYVPLAPIATAADLRLTHRPGEQQFTLATDERGGRGMGRRDAGMTATAGETAVTMPRGETLTLTEPPVSLNGMIFVSPDYLSRVANLAARWDSANLRLDLQTEQPRR